MNIFKQTALALVLTFSSMGAFAGVNGLVGYGSDYIFRGVSQTDGGAFAHAGAYYDHGSGLYAGAWLGQVDYADGSDLETDLFVGWANDHIDVMYIDYSYNGDADLDGSELMIGSEFMGVSLDYYLGQDDYSDYMELGYTLKGVDVSYGMWEDIGDNIAVSKSFDLPMGIEGSVGFTKFMAEDGSLLQDEDSFVFGVMKTF